MALDEDLAQRMRAALATLLLAGLGIREWRAGFPDAAQRIENFDREEPKAPLVSTSEAVAARPRTLSLSKRCAPSANTRTAAATKMIE